MIAIQLSQNWNTGAHVCLGMYVCVGVVQLLSHVGVYISSHAKLLLVLPKVSCVTSLVKYFHILYHAHANKCVCVLYVCVCLCVWHYFLILKNRIL